MPGFFVVLRIYWDSRAFREPRSIFGPAVLIRKATLVHSGSALQRLLTFKFAA